jgi:hypothetical protein
VTVTNYSWGDAVSFSQVATQKIISAMQDAGATAGVIGAILSPFFPTGSLVAGTVAGILGLGQGALQMADANGRGVTIDFLADVVPFWVSAN